MNQNKYKWLFFLLAIMLISNIVLAVMLFSSRSSTEGQRNKNESNGIYKELGLNPLQIDTFKTRKEIFFKEMRPLWNEIRELKDSMYKQMQVDTNDANVKLLSLQIAQKTNIADLKTYQHFTELRKFCTPEQQVRFDTIVPKFVNRRSRR